MTQVFKFKRDTSTTAIDWPTELNRYRAARAAGHVQVSAVDKATVDQEISRRIHALHFRNAAAGYVAAQAMFFERARVTGTDEAVLLDASFRGLLTVINHPAAAAEGGGS